MPPAETTSSSNKDAAEADEAGARIERLLGEVRASAGPVAWPKVEELLRALMDLYARGLGRLLDRLAESGALDDGLRRSLAGDELVASLLSLHGLHPLPAEERIASALERLAPQLGEVRLVAIEDGVARLLALDAPAVRGGAALVERVVVEAAPELVRVEVEGLREPGGAHLVQIDLPRSRARAKQ